MTNGSRIRRMSDEELAKFLKEISISDEYPDAVVIDGIEFWDEDEIIGWLKEEAE